MARRKLAPISRPGSDRDIREQYETLLWILAKAIDECESKRDLAALTRRYMEVDERLESMGSDEPDEIERILSREPDPDAQRFAIV